MRRATIHVGDALDVLRTLPDEHVQCCVTSPPYWGLRDYGVDGQLGLEETPEQYVIRMVEVFREVRRVLHPSGTLWLNLGDSYNSGRNSTEIGGNELHTAGPGGQDDRPTVATLKPKDLCLIPHRVAMALQADGWWLRSSIVWAKGNPMPESVTDRPTSSHEYVFLLSKSRRYFYDADAIREPCAEVTLNDPRRHEDVERDYDAAEERYGENGHAQRRAAASYFGGSEAGRNKRDVWHINTRPFPDAHFAVYPPDLVEPCILAGTSKKGQCTHCGAPWERDTERTSNYEKRDPAHAPHSEPTKVDSTGWEPPTIEHNGWKLGCECGADTEPQRVLDPFAGAGTTGLVALAKGRDFIGIEINPEYAEMARERLKDDAPMFNHVQIAA